MLFVPEKTLNPTTMKCCFCLLLLLSLIEQSHAQKIIQDYSYEPDSVRIGNGPKDFLQCSEKGFTLILPKGSQEFLGTVIALEDYRLYDSDTLKYQSFSIEATKKGLAFLIIATGVPVDLYFSEKSLILPKSFQSIKAAASNPVKSLRTE